MRAAEATTSTNSIAPRDNENEGRAQQRLPGESGSVAALGDRVSRERARCSGLPSALSRSPGTESSRSAWCAEFRRTRGAEGIVSRPEGFGRCASFGQQRPCGENENIPSPEMLWTNDVLNWMLRTATTEHVRVDHVQFAIARLGDDVTQRRVQTQTDVRSLTGSSLTGKKRLWGVRSG
jgi:hypothetical protein